MEVSKLNQDEIDLSLELSIGGIFRKFEKSKHQQKSISSSITFEAESCEINDKDLRRENESFLCKFSSGDLDVLDLKQKTKREIQALRRQEARKKREEKRKRRRNFILKNENEGSERFSKKIISDFGNHNLDVTNLPAFGSYPPCSIIPAQFVPFGNRFVFPYHMMSEYDLEKNGLKGQSSKSIGSGSSSVSDHDNGGSSDTITSLPQYSAINNTQCKSELTDSSESTQGVVAADEANSDTVKVVSSNTQSSRLREADDDEEPNCVSNPHDPINKAISITKNPFPLPPTSSNTQSRRSMVEHNTNAYQTQYLTQMPCVSTTGNGPRGKTINGFLYRCTKREVSIMCVCHGSSFTPAEFVKHAGGNNMDISHPMKHIFVLPSIPIS